MARSKAPNFFTTSYLLYLAADHILNNTHKSGSHPTIPQAISDVAVAFKFRSGVAGRAQAMVMHHFFNDIPNPKVKAKHLTFGKNQSNSLGLHAIANVLKNRDQRVNALLLCAKKAEQPRSQWYN